MTGEIVDFGGRKPAQADDEKALADAKACFAAHDPFQRVLDFLDRTTSRIEAAVQNIGAHPITASPLNDDQVKALTYATERAAERGVGIYAKRIASWHQAIVGGAFVAGLSVGCVGGYWLRGAPPELTCTDRSDGSRVCYMFTRLAPQQPVAPQPTTPRGRQ